MEFDIAAFASVTTDRLSGIEKAVKRSIRPRGFHLTRIATALADGVNPVILSLGRPPVNSEWDVDLVTVVGADTFTVIANSNVSLYVGDPANFSPVDCIVPSNANTVPNTVTFSTGTVWVHSEECLFVVVNGITVANTVLSAIAKVTQYAFADVEPGSSQ